MANKPDSGTVAIPKSILWQSGFVVFGALLSGVVTAIWLAATAESEMSEMDRRLSRAIGLMIEHQREIGVLQGKMEGLEK